MEKVRLLVIPAARFAANCVLVLGDEPRMNHQPGSCEEIGLGTNTVTVTNMLMAIDCR